MYYPLQIPSILDKNFINKVNYKEYKDVFLEKYIMCIWSMNSYDYLEKPVNNIIIPDGCIDLIIYFSNREIYFSGNSKTTLNFPLAGNIDFMGIRIRPGVFNNIFKVDCSLVMDNCINYDIIETEYKLNSIFNLENYEERITFLIGYFKNKVLNVELDPFVEMINTINQKEEIKFVSELAKDFNYSERQLNRIFKERCGVSVKVFLNVIRLHNSLKLIINNNSSKLIDLAHESGFYDEAHFIKEIQKYCGISPTDLVKRYNMS